MSVSAPPTHANSEICHASCVAYQNQGLLIKGDSGSGKSSLALQLMALGASLVADDRVILEDVEGHLLASAPPPLRGLIEMRGIGLLNVKAHGPVRLVAAVDMDRVEEERLPRFRELDLLGHPVTLLRRVDSPIFPAGLMQFLKSGRRSP
ncbi:MAG: serine kinase [Rhodobacteraceae bacterium]|nr:serine kinase [Paracoccaceae bacterium]